jgi:hypothetical protein
MLYKYVPSICVVMHYEAQHTAPCFLQSQVLILLRAWIFFCVMDVFCVVSGLCDELITSSEGSELVFA